LIELRRGGKPQSVPLPGTEQFEERVMGQAEKFAHFFQEGWRPHLAQTLMHTSPARWTVCGAGRRGGKTLSAAWEVSEWVHPDYGLDALEKRGVNVEKIEEEKRLIDIAVVVPEFAAHPQAKDELLRVLRARDIEHEWKVSEKVIHFPSDDPKKCYARVHFKSAVGESARLRGQSFAATWWDEPAFIPSNEGWITFFPSLNDLNACGIFTTSPGQSENHWWFYEAFIDPETADDNVEYIEWITADNPAITEEQIAYAERLMHPLDFRREYLARWERGSGGVLDTKALRFYEPAEIELDKTGRPNPDRYTIYASIDPAISEKDSADYTVGWVMAKDEKSGIGYLVALYRDRLRFHDQLELVQQIQAEWNPMYIGIEAWAYQQALVDAAMRLPGFPRVLDIKTPGKKEDRLRTLEPVARHGRIRFPSEQKDDMAFKAFLSEWAEFPTGKHDDTLDSLDIAVRVAGIFTPSVIDEEKAPEKFEARQIKVVENWDTEIAGDDWDYVDDHMGSFY
jgi:phage terminase large subunit-like protein